MILNTSEVDVSFINQCLTSLGMEGITSEADFNLRLHDITSYHMNWINERNGLEERCSKLQADSNNYLNTIDRLQGELEALKREITTVSEKERQARVKNKTLSSKLKAEEDEVRRLTLVMEHKQDHFNHELRKKERETKQHRERLSKKIMDKKPEKGSQQVLNRMPRSTGAKRSLWGNDPREDLYKQLVAEQEEKTNELKAENNHLRLSLANLESALINLLNKNGDAEDSFLEDVDLNPKIQPHAYTHLDAVQNTIKSSIDHKIELIKEKHRRLVDNKDLEEELAQLKKTVNTQQLTITEQLVALEDCTCKEERRNYSDIHDAELESRFQDLLKEREDFEKEKEVLLKEKTELRQLEEKIKLDHKKFREERTQLFESNILATPNINSIKRENAASAVTIPSEQPTLKGGQLYFSPIPSENTNLATTEEFQRELSRLDAATLHGKILNEKALTPLVATSTQNDETPSQVPKNTDLSIESSTDLFGVKKDLLSHYLNTPV